jgi:Domain of unknown function (DU1801)
MQPFEHPEVAAVFAAYPEPIRTKLLFLRQLIFDVAAETEAVGPLDETLKWGQPSYLTTASKTGTTIRIDQNPSSAGQYMMYVHCQTNLIGTFRKLYPDTFDFEGNRSIVFDAAEDIPIEALRHCIALALNYHRAKRMPTSRK